MSRRNHRYAILQPYAQCYGDTSASEKKSVAEQVEQWLPAAKTALGIDDSRKTVTTLENRLRDLTEGTPAERAAAMIAAGSLTVEGAIEKTQAKLVEAREAAFQVKTRDKLYTALTITGVVAGSMAALVLAGKAYTTFQQARIQRAEIEKLES